MTGPKHLVLVYNTLWDQPWRTPENLPPGFAFTTERACLPQADAVIFHLPSLHEQVILRERARRREGQIWVAWSMECDAHDPRMACEQWRGNFDLHMTYRRSADVWVPYVPTHFGPALPEALPFEQREAAPCCAFISSSYNHSGRLELLQSLMGLMAVDSFGSEARNREVKGDDGRPFKLHTIARYKFTLAFENAIGEDYVTEKFYDPLYSGSVPVYLGAPNIESFAPGADCYIDASHFDSPRSLAAFLQQLACDQDAYRRLLAWRRRPLREDFLTMQQAIALDPFVRLCRLLATGCPATARQAGSPG